MGEVRMKERPMLFSAPMVNAILAGIKTQTRRLVKPQPDRDQRYPSGYIFEWWSGKYLNVVDAKSADALERCRYGQIGDRIWVRETWAQNADQLSDTRMDTSIVYRADGERRAFDNGIEKRWRPSIHMPRWASRILLEITEVRAERLQDISEEDAIAEGVVKNGNRWEVPGIVATPVSAVDAYRALWEYISGRGTWDVNPYVWAITFKRVAL